MTDTRPPSNGGDALLRAILDNVLDGIVTINEQGLVESINPAAERLFGYAAAEVIGRNVNMLMPEPYHTAHDGYLQNYRQSGVKRIIGIGREVLGRRKDGSTFPMDLAVSEMCVGEARHFVGIIRDISERKKAEASIQRFKGTLDRTLDCVFMFEPDSLRFFYINQGAMDQVGYSADELMQMHPYDIKPDFTEAQFRAYIAPLLAGERESVTFVTVHQHKDGHRIPVEIFLQYIAPAGEQPRFVAFVRDISERKRAEEHLRDSAARIQSILDTVVDGIITINERGIVETINPAAERIFGYAAAEVIGQNIKMLMPEPYHSEHDGYLDHYRATGKARVIGIGREVTGRRKDGSTFPMELAVSEMQVGGKRHFTGIVRNITERKQSEAALRSLTSLQSAILENAAYAIIAATTDGTITVFNRMAERMLGYGAEEMIGQATPAIIHDPQEVAARALEFSVELGTAIAPGFEVFVAKSRRNLPNEHEWTYIRKDGTRFPVLLSVTALREGETITGFLGIAMDITERRRREADLRRSHALLDAINQAQRSFIGEQDAVSVFDRLLADLLAITDSEYGFIGEVLYKDDGQPYLKTRAITNIAWNDETRAFYAENAPKGMEFGNLKTLFGAVLSNGKPVIANDPVHDPRRGGLPLGHPPLNAFLGVPLYHGDKLVGMAGVSNRPGGYDDALIAFLEPLLATLAAIIQAMRDEALRKAATQALDRFKHALDNTLDMILMFDADTLALTYANEGVRRGLGYAAGELIGRPVFSLKTAGDSEHVFRSRIAPLLQGDRDSISYETAFMRKDGSVIPVEVFLQLVRQEGGGALFVAIARDLTERRKVERMQSEFISTVSHELRTPLTSMLGSLGLLAGGALGELPEKARHMIDIAQKNSERLVRLINDILDIEKISAGRMTLAIRAVDVVDLARHSVEAGQGLAHQQGVVLRLETKLERMTLEADPDRLTQVFANLISNAIKFSPTGGEVVVTIEKHDRHARIAVRDHGPGVPEAFRARLFGRFAQADSSDTRQKGGSGLGLAISKAIVERLGGVIAHEAPPDGGALFSVELPCTAEQCAQKAVLSSSILLCMHQAGMVEELQRLLGEASVACDVAPRASQAQRLIETRGYELIILDVGDEGEDWFAFLRELRERPDTRDTPVLILAADIDSARREFRGDWTVIDWLEKPLSTDGLRMSLQRLNVLGDTGKKPEILHVEDDADIREIVATLIGGRAMVSHAGSRAAAREALAARPFDLIILDIGLPDGSGLDLLSERHAHNTDTPVLLFTAHESPAQLARQVRAALVKSRTSNQQLLDAILRIMSDGKRKKGGSHA